ncbi:MAG: tetratricopeptide repeat protein [Candidatus Eisenbacteria bacterium]
MSETIRCPDCGHPNPPGSTFCASCHYPLTEVGAPEKGDSGPSTTPLVPPRRPVRPRRPRPQANAALSLWLGVGAFLALLLVLIAVQANLKRDNPPVEGSNRDQQVQADAFRAALTRDSTDTRSRVGLADLLFDTGNWPEAIVHYRSAVRQDSSLVMAIVDMGVCYYNLSVPDEAERLFLLALARDPHQPIALFNMGIVYERRGQPEQALKYFHSSLESAPPENMKQALIEAMQRVVKQTGKVAPPLTAPQ